MYLNTDELIQSSSSINITPQLGVDSTSYDTLLPSFDTSLLDTLSISNSNQPIPDSFICNSLLSALSIPDSCAHLPPELTSKEALATLKTYLTQGADALASYELKTVDQFLTVIQTPSICSEFKLSSSQIPMLKECQESLPLERITLVDEAKVLREQLKQINDISPEEQLFRNRAFLFEPDNAQVEFLSNTLYQQGILTMDMSIEETAANLLSYIQDTFTYQHDSVPNRLERAENNKGENEEVYDYWQSVSETLASLGGDCEDLALLTGSLLSSVLMTKKGFSAEDVSKMVTISAGYLPEQYGLNAGHTVVKLRLDDTTLALDATSKNGPVDFSSLGLTEVLEFNDVIFTTYQRIDSQFTTAASLDILLVDNTAFGEEGSANEILSNAYDANKETMLFQINLAIQNLIDQIRDPITLPKLYSGSLYGDYVAANYKNAAGTTDTEKKIQALTDFAATLGIETSGTTVIALTADEQAYIDAVDDYTRTSTVISSMKEFMTTRAFGPPTGMSADSVMTYVINQNPDLALGDNDGNGYDDLYDKFFIKDTDINSLSYNKYVFIGTPFDGEDLATASSLYTTYGTPAGYEWIDITSSDFNSGGLTLTEINDLYDENSLIIGDIETNINAAIEGGDFLLQIYDSGGGLILDWGETMDYASILLDSVNYTFVTGDASSAAQLIQYQTDLQPLYDQQNLYEGYRNSYNIVFAELDGLIAYYSNELSKETPPTPDTSMDSPPYYTRTVTTAEAAANSSLIKGQLVEIESLTRTIAQMLDTLNSIDILEKSVAQKEIELRQIPATDKTAIEALEEEIDILNNRINEYQQELTILHQFIDRDFANDLNNSKAYKFFNIYTFDQNQTVSSGEGYEQTVQSLVLNEEALFTYTNLIRHQMNKLNVLFNMSTGYMDMMLNEARGLYDMSLNDEQQKANKKAREKGDKVSLAGVMSKFQAKINSGVQEVADEVIGYVRSANEAQFAKRDLEIENWARNPISEDGIWPFIANFLTGAATELVDELTNVFSIIRAQARMELTQMQTTIASLNAIAIAEYSQKMTSGYTVSAADSTDGVEHRNVGGIRLWSEDDDVKYEGTTINPLSQDPTYFGQTITEFMDSTITPQDTGNAAMERSSKAAISSYLNNMGKEVTVKLTSTSIEVQNNDTTLQFNKMLGLALSGFDASFSGGVYDMTRDLNYSINTDFLSSSDIFHQTLPESTGEFSSSPAGDASTGSNPVAKFMKIMGVDALMKAITDPLADGLGGMPGGVSGSTSVYVDYHMERSAEFRSAANGFQRIVFIALMIQQSILEKKLDVATEMFEQEGAKRTSASSGIVKAASQALDTELGKQGSMIEQLNQYSTQITTVANKLIKNRIDYYKNTVLAPIKILKVGLQLGIALSGNSLGIGMQSLITGLIASVFLAPLGLSMTAAGLYPLTYWAYAVVTIGGAAIETAFTALELAVENTVWEFQTPVTLQTSFDNVNLPGSGITREGSNTGYSRFTYKETKYRQQQFDDTLAAMAPSDSQFKLGGNDFYNYVENKFGSLVYNSRSEFNAVADSGTYTDGYQTFTIDNVGVDASYSGSNLDINDKGMRFIEGRGNGYFNYNGILGSVKSQKSAYYQNLIRMHIIILRAMYDAIEGVTSSMFGTQKAGGMQKFEGSGFSVVDSILQTEMALVGDLKTEIQTSLEAYNSNAQKQQTLTNLEFTITQNFFDNIFSLTTFIPWGVGELAYLGLSAVGQILDVTRQFEWGPYAGKLAEFHESSDINKRESFAKNLATTFYNPNDNPDTTGWATQYMPASNPQQYVTDENDDDSFLKFYQEPYVTGDGRAIGDWLTPGASHNDVNRRSVFYELDMLELDTLNVMYRADGSGNDSSYLIKDKSGDYVRSTQTFEAISEMNDLGLVQLEYANISQAQNQLTRIHAMRSMFMMLEQALYSQKQNILKDMFGTSSSAGIMEQTMTLIDNYNNGQMEALNEIVQELTGEVESKNTYEQAILDSIIAYVGLASLMPAIYNSIVSIAKPGPAATPTVNLFRRILVQAGQNAMLTVTAQLVIGLIGFFSINKPDKVVSQLVSSEEKDAEESTDKERIDELNNKDQKTMTQAEKNELVSLNAKHTKTAEEKIQNVELDKSDHTKSLQAGPKLSSRGTFTTNAASLSIANRKLKQKFRKMKLMNEILQSMLDAQSDAAAEVGDGTAAKAYKGVSGIISKVESNEKNILQNMFSRQKQIAEAKNKSLDMMKKAATSLLTAVMTAAVTAGSKGGQNKQIKKTDKKIKKKKKQLDKLKKTNNKGKDKATIKKNRDKRKKLEKEIKTLKTTSKDLKKLRALKEKQNDGTFDKADRKQKDALRNTKAGKMEARRKGFNGMAKALAPAMSVLVMEGLIIGIAEMNGADIDEDLEGGAEGAFTEGDTGDGMETADLENASLLADVQKGNFQLLQTLLKDDIDRNKDGAKSFKLMGNMVKKKLASKNDNAAEDRFDHKTDKRMDKLEKASAAGDKTAQKKLAYIKGESVPKSQTFSEWANAKQKNSEGNIEPGADFKEGRGRAIAREVIKFLAPVSKRLSKMTSSNFIKFAYAKESEDKNAPLKKGTGRFLARTLLRTGAALKIGLNGINKGVRKAVHVAALTLSVGVLAIDAAIRFIPNVLQKMGKAAVTAANKNKENRKKEGKKNTFINKGLKLLGQGLSSASALKVDIFGLRDEVTMENEKGEKYKTTYLKAQKKALKETTAVQSLGIAADFLTGGRVLNQDYIDNSKADLQKKATNTKASVFDLITKGLDTRINSRKSNAITKDNKKLKDQLDKRKKVFEEYMKDRKQRDLDALTEKAAVIKDAGELNIGFTQRESLDKTLEGITETIAELQKDESPKNDATKRSLALLTKAKERAERATQGGLSREDLSDIILRHTSPTTNRDAIAGDVFEGLLSSTYAKKKSFKLRDWIPLKKTALGFAKQDGISFNDHKTKKALRLRIPKSLRLRLPLMKADKKRDAFSEFDKMNSVMLKALAKQNITGDKAKAIVEEINQFKGRATDLDAIDTLTAEAYKELSGHVVATTGHGLSDTAYHDKQREYSDKHLALTVKNSEDEAKRITKEEKLIARNDAITSELSTLNPEIQALEAQASAELNAPDTFSVNATSDLRGNIKTSLKIKLKYGKNAKVDKKDLKIIDPLSLALANTLPNLDLNTTLPTTQEEKRNGEITSEFFDTLMTFSASGKTKSTSFHNDPKIKNSDAQKIAEGFKFLTKEQKQKYVKFLGLLNTNAKTVAPATQQKLIGLKTRRDALIAEQTTVRNDISTTTTHQLQETQNAIKTKDTEIRDYEAAKKSAHLKLVIESLGSLKANDTIDVQVSELKNRKSRTAAAEAERIKVQEELDLSTAAHTNVTAVLNIRSEQERVQLEFNASKFRLTEERAALETRQQEQIDIINRVTPQLATQENTIANLTIQEQQLLTRSGQLTAARPELLVINNEINAFELNIDPAQVTLTEIQSAIAAQVENQRPLSENIAAQLEVVDKLTKDKTELTDKIESLESTIAHQSLGQKVSEETKGLFGYDNQTTQLSQLEENLDTLQNEIDTHKNEIDLKKADLYEQESPIRTLLKLEETLQKRDALLSRVGVTNLAELDRVLSFTSSRLFFVQGSLRNEQNRQGTLNLELQTATDKQTELTRKLNDNERDLELTQSTYDSTMSHLFSQLILTPEEYRTATIAELEIQSNELENNIDQSKNRLRSFDDIIEQEKLTPKEIKALENGEQFLLDFNATIEKKHEDDRLALESQLKGLESLQEKEAERNQQNLDAIQDRIDERNIELANLVKQIESLEAAHAAGSGGSPAFNPLILANFGQNVLHPLSTAIAQNRTLELINKTANETTDLNTLGIGTLKKDSPQSTELLLRTAGLENTAKNRFLFNVALSGPTENELLAQANVAQTNLDTFELDQEFYKNESGNIQQVTRSEDIPASTTTFQFTTGEIDKFKTQLPKLLILQNRANDIKLDQPTFLERIYEKRGYDISRIANKDNTMTNLGESFKSLGITDAASPTKLINSLIDTKDAMQQEFSEKNSKRIKTIIEEKGMSIAARDAVKTQLDAYDTALTTAITPEAKKELLKGQKQAKETLELLTTSGTNSFNSFTLSLDDRFYATLSQERKIGQLRTTNSTGIMRNVLDNISKNDTTTGELFADNFNKQYQSIQNAVNQDALNLPDSVKNQKKLLDLVTKAASFISDRIAASDSATAITMMRTLLLDSSTPDKAAALILAQLHKTDAPMMASFETQLLEDQGVDETRNISNAIAEGRTINPSLYLMATDDKSSGRMTNAADIIEQNSDASSTGSAKNKLFQSKTRTIKNIESLLSNNPTEAIRLMSTLSLEDLENNGFADMLQKERSKFTGTTNTSAHEELATSTGPNTFLIQVLAQHQNEQPNGDTPKYTSQEQTDATLVLGKLLQMGALTLDAVQTLHLSESVVTSLQNSGHIDDTKKARPLYVKNIQSETLGSELEQAIGTALINDTLKSGFSTFAGQESHIQNISNSDLVVDKSTGKLIDAKTFAHKLKTLREENPDTFVLELQNALPGASQIIETALKEGKVQDVEDILKEISGIGSGSISSRNLATVSIKLLEDIAMHLDDASRDILLNNGADRLFKLQQVLSNKVNGLESDPIRSANILAQNDRQIRIKTDEGIAIPEGDAPNTLKQKEAEVQLRSISTSLMSLSEKEVKDLLKDEEASTDIAKALVLGLSLKTLSAELLVSKVLTFLEAQQIGLGGTQVFSSFVNKFVDQTIRYNQTTTSAKRIKADDFYKSLQKGNVQKASILENRIRNGFHVGAAMIAVRQLLKQDPAKQSQYIQDLQKTKSVEAVRGLNQSLVVAASQSPEQLLALLSAQDNIEVIPGKNKLEKTLYLNHMNNMVGIQKEGSEQILSSRHSDAQLSKLSQFFQGSKDYALSTLQTDTKQPTLEAKDVAKTKEAAQQSINDLNVEKLETGTLTEARSTEIETQLTQNRSIVALADLFLLSQDNLSLSTHFLNENKAQYQSPIALLTTLSTQLSSASPQEQQSINLALSDLQSPHTERGIQQLQLLLVRPNTSFTIEQKKVMQQVINKFSGLESPLQTMQNPLEAPVSDLKTAFKSEGKQINRSLEKAGHYMSDSTDISTLKDLISDFQNPHSLNDKNTISADIKTLTSTLSDTLLPSLTRQINTMLNTAALIELKELTIDTNTHEIDTSLSENSFVSDTPTPKDILSQDRLKGLKDTISEFKKNKSLESAITIRTYMEDLSDSPVNGLNSSKIAELRRSLTDIFEVATTVIDATQSYKENALINSTIGQLQDILLPPEFGAPLLQEALDPTSKTPAESKLEIINNTLIAAQQSSEIQTMLTPSILTLMTAVLKSATDSKHEVAVDSILSSPVLATSLSIENAEHMDLALTLISISTSQGKSSPLQKSILSNVPPGSKGLPTTPPALNTIIQNNEDLQTLADSKNPIPNPVQASLLPLLKAENPQRYVQILLNSTISGALPQTADSDRTLIQDNLPFFETLSTMDNTNTAATSSTFTNIIDQGSSNSAQLLELAFNLNPDGFGILTETSHHAITAETITSKIGGTNSDAILTALQDDSDSSSPALLDSNGLPTATFLELDNSTLQKMMETKMTAAAITIPKASIYSLVQLRDIEDSRQLTLRKMKVEVQTSSSMDSSTKSSIAKTLSHTIEKSEHKAKGQFASIRKASDSIKTKIANNSLSFGGDIATIQGSLLTLPADHRMALETVSQNTFGKPLSSALSGSDSHSKQIETLTTLLGHITPQTFPTDPVSVGMAKEAKNNLEDAARSLKDADFSMTDASYTEDSSRIISANDFTNEPIALNDIGLTFIKDATLFNTMATLPNQAATALNSELPNLKTNAKARQEFSSTVASVFSNSDTTAEQKTNLLSTLISLNTPQPGEHVANSDLSDLLNAFTPMEQSEKNQFLETMVATLNSSSAGTTEERFQLIATLNVHYEGKLPTSVSKTIQAALSQKTDTSLTQLANTNLPPTILASVLTDALSTRPSAQKSKADFRSDIDLLKKTLSNTTITKNYDNNFAPRLIENYIAKNATQLAKHPDLMTTLYSDTISFAVKTGNPQLLINMPSTMVNGSSALNSSFQKALLTNLGNAKGTIQTAISMSLDQNFISSMGQLVEAGRTDNDISFIYQAILDHGQKTNAQVTPNNTSLSKKDIKNLQQKGYIDHTQQPSKRLNLQLNADTIGKKTGLPTTNMDNLISFLEKSDSMPELPISSNGLINVDDLNNLETTYLSASANDLPSLANLTQQDIKSSIRSIITNNPSIDIDTVITEFQNAQGLPNTPNSLKQYADLELTLFQTCNATLDVADQSFNNVDASLQELMTTGINQNEIVSDLKEIFGSSMTESNIMTLGNTLDGLFNERTNPFTAIADKFGINASELLDVMAPHMDGDYPKLSDTLSLDLNRFTNLTLDQRTDLAQEIKTLSNNTKDPRAIAFTVLLAPSDCRISAKSSSQGSVKAFKERNALTPFLEMTGNTLMDASIANELSSD